MGYSSGIEVVNDVTFTTRSSAFHHLSSTTLIESDDTFFLLFSFHGVSLDNFQFGKGSFFLWNVEVNLHKFLFHIHDGVIFKIASDCPLNFESEVSLNGDTGELNEAIDYWLNEHTVNGSFTQNGKTRNRLSYEQVRFPLFGKGKFGGKQKAINMDGFIKPITQFLSQFGISVSTTPIGIGKTYVVLGGK